MNHEQKLEKIRKLAPCHDWILIKLDALMQPLLDKINDGQPINANFFDIIDAENILNNQELKILNRARDLWFKRCSQLDCREKSIRDTFTPDEIEQQIIS